MMYSLERFGRIRTSVTAFVLAVVMSITFFYSRSDMMVLVVGFWMNFFIQLAGNSMQIFTSEVFPTNARAPRASAWHRVVDASGLRCRSR